jgi:zearalenone synthase (highly reducing iterative type I polyketide synthase)
VSWGAHLPSATKGKKYVALLELDNSFLEVLGEQDFVSLKELILQASSLLWVTSLDGPATALAAGLARTVRNENAESQFRTLQATSTSPNLRPKLAALDTKVATASTEDAEFLEVDGILNTSRVIEDLSLSQAVSGLLSEEVFPMPLSEASKPQKLSIQNPGMLDTLYFETDVRAMQEIGDDEVEIEVKATGLKYVLNSPPSSL